MRATYQEDLTGINPDNYVTDELHAVSETQFKDYKLIIPNFAPFYHTNFKAWIIINGVERELELHTDYSFTLHYIAGTRVTGKVLYGGIQLHNLPLNGIIKLNYQCLGGEHVVDRIHVLTILADLVYNPRLTVWDALTDSPVAFPPRPHYQDYDTLYGQKHVVHALHEIAEAIAKGTNITISAFSEFLELISGSALNDFVKRAGDEMRGPLLLYGTPKESLEAVPLGYLQENYLSKSQYDDGKKHTVTPEDMSAALNLKLNLTGGTLTGPLVLSSTTPLASHAVNRKYVDDKVQVINIALAEIIARLDYIEQNYATKQELLQGLGEVNTRINIAWSV